MDESYLPQDDDVKWGAFLRSLNTCFNRYGRISLEELHTLIESDIGGERSVCRLAVLHSKSLKDTLNIAPFSPYCECGTGKETVEHYLLECRRFKQQRKKMIRDIGKGRLNIERLLGQPQMIKHTIEFIKSTKRFEP